jgi:hypothetical protein
MPAGCIFTCRWNNWSGLGLAVTYSIVKNHGGCISVESELGTGTTFTLYFPASRQHPVENKTGKESLPAGRGRYLFMDDEELIRHVAGEILSDIGYDVEFEKTAQKQ